MSNVEPQNVEGWNRCALSFYKIDRIPSFDIRYSTFCGSSVRFLDPSFDIRHSSVLRFAVLYIPSILFFLLLFPFCINLFPASHVANKTQHRQHRCQKKDDAVQVVCKVDQPAGSAFNVS